MKIAYLKDYPEYIETVSGWIYKEFIENIRKGITYQKIVDKFSVTKKESIPCTICWCIR